MSRSLGIQDMSIGFAEFRVLREAAHGAVALVSTLVRVLLEDKVSDCVGFRDLGPLCFFTSSIYELRV